MLKGIIDFSLRNKFIVLLVTVMLVLGGATVAWPLTARAQHAPTAPGKGYDFVTLGMG